MEEVAKMYVRVGPEDLVICVPQEGLYLTMRALLEPGDHVVCQYPRYQALFEIARAMGCKVTLWEMTGVQEEEGGEGKGEVTLSFNVEQLQVS